MNISVQKPTSRGSLSALILMLGFALGSPVALADAMSEIPDAIAGRAGEPTGRNVSYFPDNLNAFGYLAEPASAGPHGAVILIHEWNGLVERVKQTADAFAAEGYLALAVDLYSGRIGKSRDENVALMQETLAAPDQIVANLDAAASYLRKRSDTNQKVATIGWCYGGGVALSYAIGGERHEGTAIFYGRLLEDPEQMKHIHHEIYGTFAEMDSGIPPEQVDRFVAALRTAGIANDVHIYDDVRHGFWLHVDRDPETNAEPAADAWQRLKKYLKRNVGE
ncbi:MAG: dienelactone hydrolase family protein [Gammaproteobacteria bacterium]